MQRVMIVGSCGAGKSTMAVKLSAIIGITVTHLDILYWQPGWVEPGIQNWRQTVQNIVLNDTWLIDGNYSRTMDLRIARADTIIYLDFNRWICLFNILKRYFLYRHKTRPDMAVGCPEKLDLAFISYVFNFPNKQRHYIYNQIEQAKGQKNVIILKSPVAIARFLKELNNAKP